MQEVVKRFARGATEEGFKSDYKQTKEQYKNIYKEAQNENDVKLKVINFIPSVSLYIFPNEKRGGVIYCENYCYKSDIGSAPRFKISEYDHPEWYKHFKDQYEKMWSSAEEIDLGKS